MEEHFYTCPYCFSTVSVLVDLSILSQEYIEDCERCCNPIEFRVQVAEAEIVSFEANSIEQ
jgi:transcription elongation factor Elf1